MTSLILLLLAFGLGLLLSRTGRFPEDSFRTLNAFVIHVSLPALVIVHIRNISIEAASFLPAAMSWIVFACGSIFFVLMARASHLSRGTTACLILCAALGNTSFVGLPMIEALYGKEYLPLGITIDQLGTFMVLSIPGLIVAANYSGNKETLSGVLKKIFTFPPFIALIVAFALRGIDLPAPLEKTLMRLGDTLAPLALFSVGLQLRFSDILKYGKELSIGLSFKLVIAPLIIWMIYKNSGLSDGAVRVVVLEAAQGPMITGAIVAMDSDLEPGLASALLAVGIPLSFIGSWAVYILMA